MTITQLEYVVAVANLGSFTKAAQYCFVTQPTLSVQIQKLEDELSTAIFIREKNNIEITEAGSQVVAKGRNILREVQGIKACIKDEKESLSGVVNLSVIPTIAPYLIPNFIGDFLKACPELNLTIEEVKTDQMIETIREGSLDIGIAASPLDEKDIKEIPLFNEPFLAYMSKDHPLYSKKTVNLEDLKDCEVLLLNQGHCFRNQVLSLCNKHQNNCKSTRFQYESGSIETLKNMISTNGGLTLIPALAAEKNIGSIEMVKAFSPSVPYRQVSLMVHTSFRREQLLKALYDSITANIPEKLRISLKNGRLISWK